MSEKKRKSPMSMCFYFFSLSLINIHQLITNDQKCASVLFVYIFDIHVTSSSSSTRCCFCCYCRLFSYRRCRWQRQKRFGKCLLVLCCAVLICLCIYIILRCIHCLFIAQRQSVQWNLSCRYAQRKSEQTNRMMCARCTLQKHISTWACDYQW